MAQMDVSTNLAFDHTRVAYERTMMAAIRTATSLITFGFSVYKFFQIEGGGGNRIIGPPEFSLLLVSIGLVALLMASLEHRQNLQELKAIYPDIRRSRTAVLGGLVSLLGIMALIAVIFRQ